MKILTMANEKFRKYSDTLRTRGEALGYNVVVVDISGETMPKRTAPTDGKVPFKPRIIKEMLSDEFLIYMDADAYPIARIDEVRMGDYDIGVTVHPPHRQRANHAYRNLVGWLNAGVLFFEPSAKGFLDIWMRQPSKYNSDQERLTTLLQEHTDWTIGSVVDVEGFRVRLFDAEIYNFTYHPKRPPKETKVVHYPGAWKSRFSLY